MAWLVRDRAQAADRAEREALRCRGCGTFPADSMDADGFPLADLPFTVEVVECPNCRQIAETRSDLAEFDQKLGTNRAQWSHVILRRVPGPDQ